MPTKIEWCDETINPVAGCSKCSPGCDNCYAEAMARRLSKMPKTAARYAGLVDERGRWTGKISKLDLSVFDRLPKKPCSVFVGSMADLFYRGVNTSFTDKILRKTREYPHHDFIFLTKRADFMRHWVFLSKKIWIGVTVCNQKEADEKIPMLTGTEAPHRFLSIEPMLGPINLNFGKSDRLPSDAHPFQERHHLIHGVIVGGETGKGARPMHPDWVRSVRDQCAAAGVPFFFKGWGEWLPLYETENYIKILRNRGRQEERWINFDGGHEFNGNSVVRIQRIGRRKSGRLLDGVEHSERPW